MQAAERIFSERVSALKTVRVFYEKTGRMKFVSHLDMNRFMIRAIRRAEIPIWYTEGFNPHPYIVFALPLPLGFEGRYEIMDLRITDDNFPEDEIAKRLNSVCPEYLNFFSCAAPVQKLKEVAFADYEIVFDDGGVLEEPLAEFLRREKIMCSKKTKKGDVKEIDIAGKLSNIKIAKNADNCTVLNLRLPAGSQENINPQIFITAFYEQTENNYYCYEITRTDILNGEYKRVV